MIYGFEVEQEGLVVAQGDGASASRVYQEARHYAAMYAEDGPVQLTFYTRQPISQETMEKTASAEKTQES